MRLYESAFNPAEYQEYQDPQMGGMLGQMMGQQQDWKSMLGNIDPDNIMPGLGIDMQTGMMNTNYDLSNPNALQEGYEYKPMQGGLGTRTNPGLSLTGGAPNSYSLSNPSLSLLNPIEGGGFGAGGSNVPYQYDRTYGGRG